MSEANILLANSVRVASESRTRAGIAEHFQHVAPVAVGRVPLAGGAYLTSSSPSIEMGIDGTTPVNFDLTPASDEVIRVNRLTLVLVQASAVLDLSKFGTITALTNGVTLKVLDTDAATVADLLGGYPLKSGNGIAAIFDLDVFAQAAAYTLVGRLLLPQPVRLDGGAGERLRMTVADNLSALTRLRVRADIAYEDTLT